MNLRTVRADDLEALWRINQAEVPAVGSLTPQRLAHIVAESSIALVAETDTANIGGFCLVLGRDADYDSANYAWFVERYERFIYLDRIAIAPPFQRNGLGTHLYAEVEHRAELEHPDATVFALEVNLIPRNDASLAFHERLGFEQVGVRPKGPDSQVSMMVKPL